MNDQFYNVLGVIGALLILFGFYRISSGKWNGKSFWYELDNVFGATCLVMYQVHLGAFISAVLNITWAIVAFRGLTSFAQRYRAARRKTSKSRR